MLWEVPCVSGRRVGDGCAVWSGTRAWQGSGRGRSGAVGGEDRAARRGRARPRRAAVRVLRAGAGRGLAGSGDVAGAAAASGRCAGGRARQDRGRVLRLRGEPHAAVGEASAGRGFGGGAGGSGPGVGRDRDRGVRAGVLREPVRVDGAAVRALRGLAVDAGGGRPCRLARRGSRADDARAGLVVEAGDYPDQDPGPYRDGRADPGAGPVPGWPAAVRVPARGCGAAPEQGARRVGQAGAPPRAGPGDSSGGAVDVRAAAGRAQRCQDHPGAERRRCPVPVRGGPGTEPAPDGRGVDAADSGGDPGQPAVYGAAGAEPAAHRLRSGRPR